MTDNAASTARRGLDTVEIARVLERAPRCPTVNYPVSLPLIKGMLPERSTSVMKIERQTNKITECTNPGSRANPKWSLVLATLAGVALAAGCSSDRHARADYSSHTTYTTSTEPT